MTTKSEFLDNLFKDLNRSHYKLTKQTKHMKETADGTHPTDAALVPSSRRMTRSVSCLC